MNQEKYAPSKLGQDQSLLKVLDYLIPENILLDVSERFKARALISIIGILFLLSIVSMGMVISVDKTISLRRLITIILIGIQPLAICLMWYKRRTLEASWYVVCLIIATIMYIDFNNMSFKGSYSITWMLPPTITVMLLGGKAALKMAVISMIAMSVNFILLKQNLLPEPITPPDKWLNVEFIISVSIMLIVTFSVFALSRMTKLKEFELSAEIESRKRIAKELEAAKNIAEQAASNKSMFLATMSHELRTPLNSILGNAELLSREKLEQNVEARVSDINSASQLLISIINDVLDLSKFDSQGIALKNERYDISDQIKRIHRMMEARSKPGVVFELKGVEKPVFIMADQNRLSQVILNLVANALKFTDAGSVVLRLIDNPDQGISIVVQDTGIGISQEDANNLFQAFVQLRKHPNRQIEGTGLGLAIIRKIVDSMDGSINLDSVEGKGSTFTVNLPLKVLDSEKIKEVAHPSKAQALMQPDLSSLSALIVDDVPMNCVILKALLEELGLKRISEAHDGEAAVERVKQGNQFDMILMDVRMPKMDGLEASQLIRALGYKKSIFAVTANAFEEDKQACLDSGMDGFLSKPIEIEKLKELIESKLLNPLAK